MRSAVACVCLLLAACGPVLLIGDAPIGGNGAAPGRPLDAAPGEVMHSDAGLGHAGVEPDAGAPQGRDGAIPRALLSVTPRDCARCFDLAADATGGTGPYQFQWDDGSRSPTRRVCVADQTAQVRVTLAVEDAAGKRSPPTVTVLVPEEPDAAACQPETPQRRLCLMNPSFEGTAAVNVGQNFDAVPWNACSNDSSTNNTPDVGSDALIVIGNVPMVQHGNTYLALRQGEQVSQALCEDVQGGVALSLQLDVSRVDLAPGDTTKVFLEIWGGLAVDCSQRKLLWASPALASTWTRYCVRLNPVEYMNQITLRAQTDVASLAPEYLVVDHLVPVDQCP